MAGGQRACLAACLECKAAAAAATCGTPHLHPASPTHPHPDDKQQVPDLDSAALAELMEMGFPEALCRNALLWGRNSLQPALEWLLQHAEDPAAAEPLR